MVMVSFGCVQRSCEEGTTLSFPPPLWGRGREGGSHELRPRLGLPPSPTLPHKGGGSQRDVPTLHIFRSKFPNEINRILLCMGLFSTFLMGRPS
ncbi:hypothetical protein ACVIU7_002547 [Bradyrhizobium liaoningense]